MTPADAWPTPPRCTCTDWYEGFAAGHMHGTRDARAELAAERLEEQRRVGERIEPASSVISGLRAVAERERHSTRPYKEAA